MLRFASGLDLKWLNYYKMLPQTIHEHVYTIFPGQYFSVTSYLSSGENAILHEGEACTVRHSIHQRTKVSV